MSSFLLSYLDCFGQSPLILGEAIKIIVDPEPDAWQSHWMFEVCAIIGTVVGGIGGAMASCRVRMDIFGIICCGTLAALGGGTLRDLLLQGFIAPDARECQVFWVSPGGENYLFYGIFASIFVFYVTKFYTPPKGTLRVLDAFAMAFFTLFGALKADVMGCSWIVTIAMGVCTGVAGGALRDLVTGNVPYVFRPGELYATASFVGVAVYLLFMRLGLHAVYSYSFAVAICFTMRMAAVYLNWQLPSYRPIYDDIAPEAEPAERCNKSDE